MQKTLSLRTYLTLLLYLLQSSQRTECTSSYDISLLTAPVIIALELIVMACFACTDHCNRPLFPYPGTYLFLQLNTPHSFVFLKFLKLQYPMSHYAVYGSSPIQSMHISGYLFPKLYLNWPDLLIKNTVNGNTTTDVKVPWRNREDGSPALWHGSFQRSVFAWILNGSRVFAWLSELVQNWSGKTTTWPKCIHLIHKQAVILRAALLPSMSTSLHPLFYYYHPSRHGWPVSVAVQSDCWQNDAPTNWTVNPSHRGQCLYPVVYLHIVLLWHTYLISLWYVWFGCVCIE